MNKPARQILYVEGNVDGTIGGSYYSLFFLVSGLDRGQFTPVVVFADNNALVTRFNAHGVRTIIRPLAPAASYSGPLGQIVAKLVNFFQGWIVEPIRLSRLLRSERIALLHLNNSIVRNHPWMIAARLARIPCITHERGINPTFPARARLLGRGLDAVICISKSVKDNFLSLGLGHLPMVTIHNGLDPAAMTVTRPAMEVRAELGIEDSKRLIGIVGNIKPWKGQETVIAAMAILRPRFPNVACLLIGDTSSDDTAYRTHVHSLIGNANLNDCVLVTGFRMDVANYVNALEIQVHASISPEPFGRVLLEGMALSKPLIASNGGAVPEIVVDGVTGLLVEPGNAEALAASLTKLLLRPELGTAMGQAGHQRLIEAFSVRNNIDQTQALYRSVLEH